MPKRAAEMSAVALKRLAEPGRYFVGGWGCEGLHLFIKPSGARCWILRYLVAGKRTDVGLGGFPGVSLQEAREKASELRKQSRDGTHPLAQKALARSALAAAVSTAITFEQAATACHTAKAAEFKNPKHAAQWISTLEAYAYPVLREKPVDAVETADVLKVLEPIWHTKTETATRVRQRIESVLNWSAAAGHRSQDIANPARWAGHLDQLLPKPNKLKKVKHHAALAFDKLPGFMKALRARTGNEARALELLVTTAARTQEVRLATWGEFDLKAKLWTVPAEHMKAKKLHKVPLPPSAIAMLKKLKQGKPDELVFGAGMHENTLTNLLDVMKYDVTAHGFRSSFKDWARSTLSGRYDDEVSELQLAHVSDDKTRAAYARNELLELRAKLMKEWDEFLSAD